MGIRFTCPNGHKLHVKTFLAGKRGVCPNCGARFLIPAAQEGQEAANIRSVAAATSPLPPAAPIEASPPSIIIAVTDPPAMSRSAAVPPAVTTSPVPPTQVVASAPPAAPAQTNGPTLPAVVREPAAAASLDSKYVAHRQRSRHNQMTIAVALLLAVIALALVLIWVLRRGPAQSSFMPSNDARIAQSRAGVYVANAEPSP